MTSPTTPPLEPSTGPLRVGIGGPVGSGKTALTERLCRLMSTCYSVAAITNDIYTKEDAEFLTRVRCAAFLNESWASRPVAAHTPRSAKSASINLAAVADMSARFPGLELSSFESGGDNLAATFGPELADLTIYVIDVSAGDKIPRKGGPGITRSDLLVINKIDLAPLVGSLPRCHGARLAQDARPAAFHIHEPQERAAESPQDRRGRDSRDLPERAPRSAMLGKPEESLRCTGGPDSGKNHQSIRPTIVRERRQYNQWVRRVQTLEDYALRYTAGRARKSAFRVGNTALGPIAFLACEAIGGTITIAYGFQNAVWAIAAFTVLMFLIGLPIAYYAARYGVDIDLLTRGAGFGYMGSTLTSLIYASFTFLLFSIEASIMSVALHMLFAIPIAVAHIISSLVVIPIAIYGISLISRMQLATQAIWLVLQFLPLVYVATRGRAEFAAWTGYAGHQGHADGTIDFMLFGMAASMLLSLLPQIGEQVDYLRFLPLKERANRAGWWTALLISGPGWVVLGAFKLLAGSFLAFLCLRHGIALEQASEPSTMYSVAFQETVRSPTFALVLAGVFVVVCQLKINVTNAYAGSIAWSNFFSRLTHTHPGRVVWLVFNVVLALLLMEIGIFRVIDGILRIYANFAAGWIGALVADLIINKPLGLSPPGIEFKRAHLYDINPVGVGALLASVLASTLTYLGMFGTVAQILSPFVGLVVAFVTAPLIAWATQGRYYLARPDTGIPADATEVRCTICENTFERRDVALCPAYSGPICSLCCTLEARCRDHVQNQQPFHRAARLVPEESPAGPGGRLSNTRAGHFIGLLLFFNVIVVLLLSFIYRQYSGVAPAGREVISTTLWLVFLCLLILSGVGAWLTVLAHESRRTAEQESARQTAMLMEEIEAHKRTRRRPSKSQGSGRSSQRRQNPLRRRHQP